MKKKIYTLFSLFLAIIVLSSCGKQKGLMQFHETYLDVFDTVTQISGFADTEEEFLAIAEQAHEKLMHYHRLFDIYHEYEGIANLKTVNEQAGIAPVNLSGEVIELLEECKKYEQALNGKMNPAMGAVLSLWHDARENAVNNPESAALPDTRDLQEAMKHCSFDTVIIDKENSTVYISDPQQSLDVGAVAKGWAAERVSRELPEGMMLNVGGDVCITGKKPDGKNWVVGVQYPDDDGFFQILDIPKGTVVTSGDYQRYFDVDGKRYHHIIDPETGFPSAYWRSVTVIASDSGLADALSTALFVADLEEGQRFLDAAGAEAMWLSKDGVVFYSPGFEKMIHY